MRFVLLALAVSTSAAHAGPLGTVWRTKVGKGCPGRQSTTNGLVITTSTGGTLHDAAKGTATAFSRPAVLKDGYFAHGIGDTYVYTDISKTIVGVNRATGTVVWRRDQDPAVKRGVIGAVPAGTDVVIRTVAFEEPIRVTIERLDAATGKSKWKVAVPTKRERFAELLASAKRVYVVTQDMNPKAFSIVALDGATGKPMWSVDDGDLGFIPEFAVHGDDLITIADTDVRLFAAATGKRSAWKTYPNADPIYADGAVYATPVSRELEAFDPATGMKRWSTPLPDDPRHPNMKTLGVSRGVVYLADGQQLRTFDAKTGKLLGSYGIAGAQAPIVNATAPAVTFCEAGHVVALDPTSNETDRRMKITGRVRCTNCKPETKLAVRIGDAVAAVGADKKFALEVVGRGKHAVTVGDATYDRARETKVVTFDADRDLNLGELRVKVPEPGDDRTHHP